MSKFTRLTSLTLVFVLLLSLLSGCGSAPAAADIYSMREGLKATDIVEEMGLGLNLGNTFEAYYNDDTNMCGFSQVVGDGEPGDYEGCWGAVETTREIIDGIRDSGFKTLRVPVFWGNGMADGSDFKVSSEVIDRVEEVVKWALEDGLYVVINMHHYDERLIMFLDREDAVAAAGKVWTQVAEHFKDYGDHLIFEGYNEYLGGVKVGTDAPDSEKFDYCNEMNQIFVDSVRATGGNNAERILIASGFNTNIDRTTSDGFKMPTDSAENKLMVSVHYIDNNMYWSNQIGSKNWHDYSVAQCELLKNRFTAEGIPVFVGECTGGYSGRMVSSSEYGSSQDCVRELIRLAKEDYGFIPVIWDTHNSDGSSFYNRIKCEVSDSENAETVRKYGK